MLSELPKERHERPMLSLDKTKDVGRLREFLGGQKAVISWKLDGLTIVLTYRNGELEKAVTRGNGEVGEVITSNARVFRNLPLRIPFTGELVLRGEAVIGYKDFEKINDEIEDVDARYKNPRNLCSGSVRQLNSEITAQRNVRFYAFTLVRADGVDLHNSRLYQMDWLSSQGFDVVEHHPVTAETIESTTMSFIANLSQVVHSIRASARPPMMAPEVGVNRFTTPMALEKIMTMTSGEKPSCAASGPMIGMETVAMPELDGIKNESTK